MFSVEFETDNAAFCDDAGPYEAAAILRAIADKIESGHRLGPIRDSNGNHVGDWSIELPGDDEDEDDDA